jgi:hypothetical protein
MYHTYPYKAQIPILIEGKYEQRTFTSDKEVWDVIQLLIDETKEENKKGNILINNSHQKDISRYMYSKQFNISPYKGSYGDQPKKWIEKTFLLNNLIERQKAKVLKHG